MFLFKRSIFLVMCVAAILMPLSGCSTLNHNIGTGAPDGSEVASDRAWYILWGLVPLNKVDGAKMATDKGLSNNYTIQSQTTFLDCILNFVTGIVSISGQSVKVLAPAGATTGAQSMTQPGGNADNFTIANQAVANKDYSTALRNYQAAANANPNNAAAYQGMGTCYYYMGQKAEALSAFEKALQLDPGNTQLSNFVRSLK